MESSEFQESSTSRWEDRSTRLFNLKSQRFVFFSILCALLKAEAIFTFFAYWIKGLQRTSGSIAVQDHNTLFRLWLLKPVFSLLIDVMSTKLSQRGENPENSQKEEENINLKKSNKLLMLQVSNDRVAILVIAEYLMASSSVALYVMYALDLLDSFLTNILIYVLGLSLVCTSSYGEGLFCRYVRSRGHSYYLSFVSIRLSLSAMYGFTTILWLLVPVMFDMGSLGKFLQINAFFPLFTTFNAVFLFWLISGSKNKNHSSEKNDTSPISSPVQLGREETRESDNFSVECMISLLLLLLVTMKFKNEIHSRFRHPLSNQYLYMLSTQAFKFLTSVFIIHFLSLRSVTRISTLIFAATIMMIYPFKSYTQHLLQKMAELSHREIIGVGLLLSFLQQILVTYALMVCLYITPEGFEASTLSLPSFVLHFTHLCMKRHVSSYLNLSERQTKYLKYLTFFALSYCLSVLININHPEVWEKWKRSIPDKFRRKKRPESKKEPTNKQRRYHLSIAKTMYNKPDQGDPKSPWEQHSEVSYDSDLL